MESCFVGLYNTRKRVVKDDNIQLMINVRSVLELLWQFFYKSQFSCKFLILNFWAYKKLNKITMKINSRDQYDFFIFSVRVKPKNEPGENQSDFWLYSVKINQNFSILTIQVNCNHVNSKFFYNRKLRQSEWKPKRIYSNLFNYPNE